MTTSVPYTDAAPRAARLAHLWGFSWLYHFWTTHLKCPECGEILGQSVARR